MIARGSRVRWDAVASFAVVITVRPRTRTALVSPDYAPTELVNVDLAELTEVS